MEFLKKMETLDNEYGKIGQDLDGVFKDLREGKIDRREADSLVNCKGKQLAGLKGRIESEKTINDRAKIRLVVSTLEVESPNVSISTETKKMLGTEQ